MENQDMSLFIGTVVGLYPIEVVNLLRNNGFVPQNQSPKSIDDIISLTVTALETSANFRIEFVDLSLSNENEIKGRLMGGEFLNKTGASPSASSGFDFGGVIKGALDFGATIWKSDKDSKIARDTAKATLDSNKMMLEAQRLQLEGKKIDAETALMLAQQGGGAKSNTALYIGLGIGGLLIVGLLAVMLLRKK